MPDARACPSEGVAHCPLNSIGEKKKVFMSKEEARTRNWLLRAFSEKWIPHYYNEPAPPYPHPCPCKKKNNKQKKPGKNLLMTHLLSSTILVWSLLMLSGNCSTVFVNASWSRRCLAHLNIFHLCDLFLPLKKFLSPLNQSSRTRKIKSIYSNLI